MYYRHNLNYQYPQRSDQHMIDVKHLRDVVLDENYPYLQKSFLSNVSVSFCTSASTPCCPL